MSKSPEQSNQQTRAKISLAAGILIGIVLIASGSGKIFGFGEVPGQTIEFIGLIIPDALLTAGTVYFIYDILMPYIIPWAELSIGLLLIIGFMPKFMSVFCILLSLVFMGNNAWAISQGLAKYPTCECFGIWEEIFGGLTPVQSLGIDIGLFILALIIIFIHPGGFWSSRKWLANLGKRKNNKPVDITED